ncbi:hypothetical protein PHMEG_00011744 [Phytophthora megakarya]|uniref:Uncharacterized protein n=1 Tax=Phytophthora megakarya TaxID=4795 RepID=A0A225WBX5_9STRA|nr:hypothetical protein PHMEG_00011744 [Phytophthora megakarya]
MRRTKNRVIDEMRHRSTALPTNRFGIKNGFSTSWGFSISPKTSSLIASREDVDVLGQRFARGCNYHLIIIFDATTLPPSARYNPTVQFRIDKLNHWDTEVFICACAKSS